MSGISGGPSALPDRTRRDKSDAHSAQPLFEAGAPDWNVGSGCSSRYLLGGMHGINRPSPPWFLFVIEFLPGHFGQAFFK